MKLKLIKYSISSDAMISLKNTRNIIVMFIVDIPEVREMLRREQELEKKFDEEVRKALGLRENEVLDVDEDGREYVIYVECDDDDNDDECEEEVRKLTKEQKRILKELRKKHEEERRKLLEEKEKMIKELIEKLNKSIPNVLEIEI